jgi:autotransporter passenger strand-loop-strand repeat protein
MTVYRTPPNQSDLVLNSGDSLYVLDGNALRTTINAGGIEYVDRGFSVDTTINSGGIERVEGDGRPGSFSNSVSKGTTINTGGLEIVLRSAHSEDTTINTGGVERITNTGYSENTTINTGGREIVEKGGFAIDTVIHTGGVERVTDLGEAINVIFSGPGATLILDNPSELMGSRSPIRPGIISGWQVGDVIVVESGVNRVVQTGNELTVVQRIFREDVVTTYKLVGQQANTGSSSRVIVVEART